MFFKFKMSIFKNILLFFVVCFFVFSSLAQPEDQDFPDDADFDEESISCENLLEAFRRYNADAQLDRSSVTSALLHLAKFLRGVSERSQIQKSELDQLIQSVDDVRRRIQSNAQTLVSKGYDLEDFLEECLDPPST